MKPAWSVILFTTLAGAGQGLFLALFTVQCYALLGLLPAPDARLFYAHGSGVALVLLGAGLVASFFHLGRPERAWRTATMWRTSWLSREVIALPAFMGLVLAYGAAHWLGPTPVLVTLGRDIAIVSSFALGALATLVALALFVCTAMIYASVRFLREWATPLTAVNFVLMGGASGFTLGAAFASRAAPELLRFLAGWAIVLTLLAALARVASLVRNARLRPLSSVQTAIGIKHPRIVQKSMGFMGGSFNTREFFHGATPGALRGVKWLFLALAFALPVLLLAAGAWQASSTPVLALAFAAQYAGLLAERWFFFAQANHPQNLYYQAVT